MQTNVILEIGDQQQAGVLTDESPGPGSVSGPSACPGCPVVLIDGKPHSSGDLPAGAVLVFYAKARDAAVFFRAAWEAGFAVAWLGPPRWSLIVDGSDRERIGADGKTRLECRDGRTVELYRCGRDVVGPQGQWVWPDIENDRVLCNAE